MELHVKALWFVKLPNVHPESAIVFLSADTCYTVRLT